MKAALGFEEEKTGFDAEFDKACSMSRTTVRLFPLNCLTFQRMYAFGTCFVVGWLLTLLVLCLMLIHTFSPNSQRYHSRKSSQNQKSSLLCIQLVTCYRWQGTVRADSMHSTWFGSTMFLFGPVKQLKTMFDPIRAAATVVFLVSLVATIILAVIVRLWLPVVCSMIIQLCAMV